MAANSDLTKEDCIIWLKNLGLSTSGSKDELLSRMKKFQRFPNLVRKLQLKAERNYSFSCSLNPIDIPPISAKWTLDEKYLLFMNDKTFYTYASQKSEGSSGQQEKAAKMLQSRKIVNVKSIIQDTQNVYVKAIVKKSYGQESRPATTLFENGVPKKSHCPCPVGASGLCCHVLALLLYLKHFSETGEKMLELTCTQQLQKWHRRTGKGSIPMVPLKNIKLKSAKLKKKDGTIKCCRLSNFAFQT